MEKITQETENYCKRKELEIYKNIRLSHSPGMRVRELEKYHESFVVIEDPVIAKLKKEGVFLLSEENPQIYFLGFLNDKGYVEKKESHVRNIEKVSVAKKYTFFG